MSLARAPGKLVLSGAYSVLSGAPALVVAVDRYVLADSTRPPAFLTPEVHAAIGERAAPWFDASALREGEKKLGLGSSAAILVASLAALELDSAPGLSDDHALAAQEIALNVAGELDVVGVLAVELFDTADAVLVNELAMRPHNSGHWTIDGALTSQFENHLRAVLDLPLGAPTMLAPHVVMVNVLGGDLPDLTSGYLHCMARDPGLKLHDYGKQMRPGRKVGHVTTLGDDLDDAIERGRHAAAYLRGEIDG